MRKEAIEKLIAAREMLANKIADAVNDHDGDFAEDFSAEGYRGYEADELLEMGDRLVKLAYIIQAMPAEPCGHAARELPNDLPIPPWSGTVNMAPFYDSNLGDPWVPGNWDTFLSVVAAGEIDEAARQLASLLTIDAILAKRCARHFAETLTQDYIGTMAKLKTFRAVIQVKMAPTPLALMNELFNLPENLAGLAYRRLKDST